MSIIQTVTDPYHFYEWMKKSDNYKNNFTLEGAKALQAYFENISDETGEYIEFDPIAWLCEFTEYKNIKEAYKQYYFDEETEWEEKTTEEMQEYFQNNTTVIEFDGGIIVQDF